jgi:hypothetical protein
VGAVLGRLCLHDDGAAVSPSCGNPRGAPVYLDLVMVASLGFHVIFNLFCKIVPPSIFI